MRSLAAARAADGAPTAPDNARTEHPTPAHQPRAAHGAAVRHPHPPRLRTGPAGPVLERATRLFPHVELRQRLRPDRDQLHDRRARPRRPPRRAQRQPGRQGQARLGRQAPAGNRGAGPRRPTEPRCRRRDRRRARPRRQASAARRQRTSTSSPSGAAVVGIPDERGQDIAAVIVCPGSPPDARNLPPCAAPDPRPHRVPRSRAAHRQACAANLRLSTRPLATPSGEAGTARECDPAVPTAPSIRCDSAPDVGRPTS